MNATTGNFNKTYNKPTLKTSSENLSVNSNSLPSEVEMKKKIEVVKQDFRNVVGLFAQFVEEAGDKLIDISSNYLRDGLKTMRKRIEHYTR